MKELFNIELILSTKLVIIDTNFFALKIIFFKNT